MQSLQPTPVRHACPQLRRLHFFSPHNHRLIADYLTHLRVRHYAPSTQEGTLRALKCFAVLMPAAHQALLSQDLTQTTPADIDAWIAAAFQQGLAPGTIVTCRRGMQGFFLFLCTRGVLAQSTHVKGAGTYESGVERPRIQVTLATQIDEAECRALNLGYRDPRSIEPAEWRAAVAKWLACDPGYRLIIPA